jgi:hypothetical protein
MCFDYREPTRTTMQGTEYSGTAKETGSFVMAKDMGLLAVDCVMFCMLLGYGVSRSGATHADCIFNQFIIVLVSVLMGLSTVHIQRYACSPHQAPGSANMKYKTLDLVTPMRAYTVFTIIESLQKWCASIVPLKPPLHEYTRLVHVVYN